MAWTAGTSNIKVLFPYSITIGTQVISAEKVEKGISLITDLGDMVILPNGQEYERSETVSLRGVLVNLSDEEKEYLFDNINTSLDVTLRLDANAAYEYIKVTGVVLNSFVTVKAGTITKHDISFEITQKNNSSILTYATFTP